MIVADGRTGVRPWVSVSTSTTTRFKPLINNSIGNLLLKRLILAIGLAVETRNDFRRFHTSLQTENPTELAAMEAELAAWEIDHDKPDPYLLPKSSTISISSSVLSF